MRDFAFQLARSILTAELPRGLQAADFEELVIASGVGLIVVLALWVVFIRRRRSRAPVAAVEPALDIEVSLFNAAGPPDTGPLVTCYHVPVRTVLLVLAPLGRGSELPTASEMPQLADQIVPGLAEVLKSHETLIRRWPQQLSSRGFAHTFLSNLKLPGERGRGSSWCALVGRFESGGKSFLAGMALCAAQPNNLGEITIEREPQWLDVLRIKPNET